MTSEKEPGKIGLLATTSLVIGNMIGSGVFLLPATLAGFGGIGLLGWVGSSFGAIILALLFSRLSKKLPHSLGGPYAYSRAGLGEFAGFIVAWGYWISIWATNAAITVTLISYLTVFVPELETNPVWSIAIGLKIIWLLTWINTWGVKSAGFVQTVTVILKLVPLLMVTFVGLLYINTDNYAPFNISGKSDFSAIAACATLTLFAFLGLESATIPSGNIKNPERTIPRATMIGTLITIVVYILSSAVVMGMIPGEKLAASNAPFADAAAIIWGENARYLVAIGAIISTFGALNGWILLQGQMPMAAAKDKLFPKLFAWENKNGTPFWGIVISSALISGMLLMNFSKGLSKTFEFMVLLTTFTVLIPYLFSAASYGILVLQNKYWKKESIGALIIATLGFVFSLWAIWGSGEPTVFWGVIAILAGIPFYIWMKRNTDSN